MSLEASITRVSTGSYTDEDIQVLISALQAGQALALGEKSIAVGGSANDAVIVPGDNNKIVIRKGATQEEIRQVLLDVLPQFFAVPKSTPELSPEELRSAMLAFLQDIETKFKETRLFHTKQPILLKDQYVPIQVTLEPHKRDVETLRGYWETEEELKRAYALKGGEEKAEEELKRQQMDWQEAKQKHQRIMVLADPGMGKSTLLRMEAGMLAQQEQQALINGSKTLETVIFPVCLRLSNLAEVVQQATDTVLEAIFKLVKAGWDDQQFAKLKPSLEAKLRKGQCLLLLDALDEVPRQLRDRLTKKLKDFVRNYPCSIICTSRIVGYDGNFLAGGQEVEIVPFGERQIDQYVTTWFTNAAEHLSDGSVSAAALIRELRSNPQVRGLVQNPLMLSLICSLYQEKGLTLPARRAQVYEKAVEYMLEKWNQARHSQFSGKTRAKLRLLEALAYHFSCEDAEVFDLDDLYDWMEEYLDEQAPRDLKDAGTEALIAEFSEEDGILQKLNQDGDQYLFLHRTFQEYLTASYLARAKDGIELAKVHFWEYDWHETISLMAGLMKQPLSLLQAITSEKDDIFQTQLLLAGRCLAECRESSHPLMTEIIDRIYQFWLRYPGLEFIRSVLVAVGQTHLFMREKLQTALNSEDNTIAGWVAEVLGQIGNDKAVDALILALNDEDSIVRWSAAAAMRKMDDDKAVDALILALNDEDSAVRGWAALTLGQIGNDKAVDALIFALNDEDSIVRDAVIVALQQIDNNKRINALIPEFKIEDSSVSMRKTSPLQQTDNSKAIDTLIPNIRWSIAVTLGLISDDEAINALITTSATESSDMRENATETLSQVGQSLCLAKLLQSPQVDIYHPDVFRLARLLAIRFHREGLPFIPVYSERVAGIRGKEQAQE